MAIVAKWLTHRIVAPALVGSIPIVRPNEDSAKFVGSFFAILLLNIVYFDLVIIGNISRNQL